MRSFVSAIASIVAIAGCGGPPAATLSYGESARRDFERAQEAVDDNDCLTATPLLQNVRREYPYSRYAALAELRLADCELAQQHYTEAIRGYRSFIRTRPTHPEVDTANFQIAVSYFRQIPSDFFLSPPPDERDQAATRSALRIVRRFLLEFPESEHIEEARRIEQQVLALLARHELYVAGYYLQRDRPQATIGRLRTLLDLYEGSGVEPEALMLLGRTHLHVRQGRQARIVFAEVIDRFPESGFAVQACQFLRAMGHGCDEPVTDTGEPADLEGEASRPDPGTGAIRPGTDIDDVTDAADAAEHESDAAEDASEAGITLGGGGVRAGGTAAGATEGDPDVDPEEEGDAEDEDQED